ncbi:hypothetical protein CDD83_9644 [Cordyceps sp. RAO-2017]|nr:hypothetical protein CDD83_9644 [Cordyceps sp. RAO-2017]
MPDKRRGRPRWEEEDAWRPPARPSGTRCESRAAGRRLTASPGPMGFARPPRLLHLPSPGRASPPPVLGRTSTASLICRPTAHPLFGAPPCWPASGSRHRDRARAKPPSSACLYETQVASLGRLLRTCSDAVRAPPRARPPRRMHSGRRRRVGRDGARLDDDDGQAEAVRFAC